MSFDQEENILKGCQTNCKHAQKALYARFAPTMFGICLRYASDYHTAEDILQDGFVKVFRNISKFRSEGSLEGWMKRIFVNTAIEYYRKVSKTFRFSPLEVAGDTPYIDQRLFDLERNELLELIQQLPHGYRLVFNLYIIEGYTHDDISKKLNINIGTSKSQLARAKKYLRKLINMQKASEERSLQQARSFIPGYA